MTEGGVGGGSMLTLGCQIQVQLNQKSMVLRYAATYWGLKVSPY